MVRKAIITLFAVTLAFATQAATPAAAQDCNPQLDMVLTSQFSTNDSVEYGITLPENHTCGDNIGVLVWLRVITRPDVNAEWSAPVVLDFKNISPEELPLYALYGPYQFDNIVNIEAATDGLWSKFQLEFVIFNHDTGTDTSYVLGWMDGPNNTGTLNPAMGGNGGFTVQPSNGGSRGTLQGAGSLRGN